MENINEKIAKFWNEILTGDYKKLNFSPQELIELYDYVREQEQKLSAKKSITLPSYNAENLELKLKAISSMKLHIVKFYQRVTSDKTAAATLEKWHNSQRSLTPKANVVAYQEKSEKKNTKKPSSCSMLLMGFKKNASLLEINKCLHQEGVWKGRKAETQIAKADMLKFYLALCLDRLFLNCLKKNPYVNLGTDLENRLKGVLESCYRLCDYYEYNFKDNPEKIYSDWYNYIRTVLKADIERLEWKIISTKKEENLLDIQEEFSNFWKKMAKFDYQKPWLNLTTQIGLEHGIEPEAKMFILHLLEDVKDHNSFAVAELMNIIQHSDLNIIGIEEPLFHVLEKHLRALDTTFKRIRCKKYLVVIDKSLKNNIMITIG